MRHTRAHHTATTGLAGFLAGCSLALAPGSVGRVSLVEASVEALDRASAEALADAALVDGALLVAGSPGAGDLPMVRLADSTVAAAACTAVAASTVAEGFTVAADSTVVVAVMAADTGN
jgi:hypothetical protein